MLPMHNGESLSMLRVALMMAGLSSVRVLRDRARFRSGDWHNLPSSQDSNSPSPGPLAAIVRRTISLRPLRTTSELSSNTIKYSLWWTFYGVCSRGLAESIIRSVGQLPMNASLRDIRVLVKGFFSLRLGCTYRIRCKITVDLVHRSNESCLDYPC